MSNITNCEIAVRYLKNRFFRQPKIVFFSGGERSTSVSKESIFVDERRSHPVAIFVGGRLVPRDLST